MNAERARIEYPPPTVEEWISKQLGWHRGELRFGTTDEFIRRDRIRARIIELGLADATAGRRNGEPESWRALFFRLYREDLFSVTNVPGGTEP